MELDYTVEDIGSELKICSTDDHHFGTDAILLFDFAEVKRKDRVCDFGTGCGIIGVLTAKKCSNQVFGVDIQPKAVAQAKISAQMSGLMDRFTPILADIKELKGCFSAGDFTLIFCNPPYYKVGSGKISDNEAKVIARQEIKCNIDDIACEAYKYLCDKGRLCVCHKPERLADVMASFRKYKIEPKRIQFVKSGAEKSPWLFLIEGRKNASAGLKVLPDLVIEPGSEPTDTYAKYREEMKK